MERSLYEWNRNINLNEIQLNELMSQSHRTKSISKGIKIVSKTKDPQICCIPHGRRGLARGLLFRMLKHIITLSIFIKPKCATLLCHNSKICSFFFIGYKNTAPERTFKSVEKLHIGLNIQRPKLKTVSHWTDWLSMSITFEFPLKCENLPRVNGFFI